jgi:hypothetical protein
MTTITFTLPNGTVETREQRIKRLEGLGMLDRDCKTCQQTFLAAEDPLEVFAPRHRASRLCRSGGHDHCTCSACWD